MRGEHRAADYRFFSTSDTEVILKAFDHWGPRCVDRFLGMFAFAIYEERTRRLTLVRDRLGIKPLYLAFGERRLRFASTLPALLAGGGIDTELDRVALHHFLSWHGVVPAPLTVLRGVRKLAPATVMTVQDDGTTSSEVYWNPDFARAAEYADWSEAEWATAVLAALRVAVQRRMVADVHRPPVRRAVRIRCKGGTVSNTALPQFASPQGTVCTAAQAVLYARPGTALPKQSEIQRVRSTHRSKTPRWDVGSDLHLDEEYREGSRRYSGAILRRLTRPPGCAD